TACRYDLSAGSKGCRPGNGRATIPGGNGDGGAAAWALPKETHALPHPPSLPLMPSPHKKSEAYGEAMLREAVSHVEACIRAPLEDLGYTGPHARLDLTDGQHDFLAGYIYGALERLLELGELDTDEDVERAANRLYARL